LAHDFWIQDDDAYAENMEFENKFVIPGALWHRLYAYQQTALKWLWELHMQGAGGILGVCAFIGQLHIPNTRFLKMNFSNDAALLLFYFGMLACSNDYDICSRS
jgi:hypothetical protein